MAAYLVRFRESFLNWQRPEFRASGHLPSDEPIALQGIRRRKRRIRPSCSRLMGKAVENDHDHENTEKTAMVLALLMATTMTQADDAAMKKELLGPCGIGQHTH